MLALTSIELPQAPGECAEAKGDNLQAIEGISGLTGARAKLTLLLAIIRW